MNYSSHLKKNELSPPLRAPQTVFASMLDVGAEITKLSKKKKFNY